MPGLLTDRARLDAMGAAARGVIPLDADEKLARIILDAAGRRGGVVRIPVPDEILPAAELGRVHCVGIGGAGISAIARIMAARGITVTGSDDHDTPFLPALRELGVTCHLGYDAAHVGDADTLVVTTAAREDNPEVLEARRRGLRILPRSAGLAAVMAGSRVLAVAGTHGKTTTTGLLTSALLAAGADPSYAVGGVLTATGRNADAGTDDLFVAEADESDGAFLVYRPHAAIVTNVEADHLDNWGTEEAYHRAFEEFADTIDRGGFLVCVRRRPRRRRPRRARPAPQGLEVVTVGESADADLRIHDLALDGSTSTCRVSRGGADLGELAAADPRSPLRPRRRRRPRHGPAARLPLRRASPTGSAASPAPAAGWSSRARPPACASTTPTPTTPSRSAATSRPPARWPARAASSPPSSRTSSPAPASSARRWASRSARPTRSSSSTSTSPARTPTPTVTGRLVADAVPLPPEHVDLRRRAARAAAQALAERARPGDLVITLGAGDITGVGPQVLDLLAPGGALSGAARTAPHGAPVAASRAASGPAAGCRCATSLAPAGRRRAASARRSGWCSSPRPCR